MICRKATEVDWKIGQNVRAQRIRAALSQAVLGDRVGVGPQQIQRYEAGTNRLPVSTLVRIADVLNVPPARFFEVDNVHD